MKIYTKKSITITKLQSIFNLNTTLWFVFVVFILVQIFLTIHISTTGATLAALEKKEQELIRKNHEFNEELVNYSSLLSLENIAEDLGYIKPQKTFYIGEESSVAKLP